LFDRVKILALEAAEFIRRFLLHVVPDGFVRIGHFGLLANRMRVAKLARCRALLAHPGPPTPVEAVGSGKDGPCPRRFPLLRSPPWR
jgi:hypothetical protein